MLTSPVTRVEISRSRLIANFKYLRSLLPASEPSKRGPDHTATTDLLAVVKANAYGHGLSPCAPWLVQAGAKWLGITSVEEGVALRRLCPKVRILVMRGLMHGEADALIDAQLDPHCVGAAASRLARRRRAQTQACSRQRTDSLGN